MPDKHPEQENLLDGFKWQKKGLAYYDKFEFDRAIECYQKSIRINPNDASTWSYLGCVYNDMWEYNKALKCFKKSIEIE